MKSIFRNVVFYSVSLFLTSQLITGLKISGDLTTYVIGGAVLSVLFFIVKPILSIVTLPLNIITLGFFFFIINAIILYLLTIFVSNIAIAEFSYPGFAFAGFVIPSFYVNNFFAFIVVSFVLSFIITFLKWLTQK